MALAEALRDYITLDLRRSQAAREADQAEQRVLGIMPMLCAPIVVAVKDERYIVQGVIRAGGIRELRYESVLTL